MNQKKKIPQVHRYDIVLMYIENGWVSFRKTTEMVFAPSEEEAMALAKKAGFPQPILERVDEPRL